jgi:two-component system sensor histidine kinase DegS
LKIKITFIILFLLVLSQTRVLSQAIFYKEINFLRKYELDSVKFNSEFDEFTNSMISWQLKFLKEFNIYQKQFNYINKIPLPKKTSILGAFLYYINRGDYLFYKFNNKNIEANEFYLKSLEIALKNKNKQLVCESLKKILNLNRLSYLDGNSTYMHYIKLYKENNYDTLEIFYRKYYQSSLSFQYGVNDKWNRNLEKELINFLKKSKNHLLNSKINQLIGSYYHKIENNKLAIEYELEAFNNLKNIKYNYKSTTKKIILISLIRYSLFSNNNSKSQYYLNLIDTLKNNKHEERFKKYSFFYQSYLDTINNNYKSAYFNLAQYLSLTETQNIEDNATTFQKLETKYQTVKKEKENLQLKQDNLEIENKRKQNLNLLIASILTFLLGSIIATLVLKNSKRKTKLAEQENELEKQKNITFLKEQEITTINAMVAGQEKERKQIAEDLHDNLGSVLATLKLHFENLKINRERKKTNQKTLFDKTENLIDEAYLKVRSIAHAKNAGVIANQGLLVAVQMMAEKISSSNKIQIEVIHFGLDKRLENSLEITVFRITQELITNIIKHAEATKATINLSLYEKNLNLIIEDNGLGFDTNKINFKRGMGLHSIKTRIAHLKGTFNIDATLGKGSSILMDIPIG